MKKELFLNVRIDVNLFVCSEINLFIDVLYNIRTGRFNEKYDPNGMADKGGP